MTISVHIIEVVRLAKYNLYRYIGCIIYQSNWSGPFSLVVMTPDLYSGDRGSRLGQVKSFYLQVYIYPSTKFVPCARMTTVRAKRRSCVYGVNLKSLGIPKTFDTNVSL